MELIDKDALIESFRETVKHAFEWKERVKGDEITSLCADRAIVDFTEAKLRVESMPTVDAVPVSYIQQRIDHLHELAEYEMEANGGYTGKVHTEVYALRRLINYWKAEQSAKDK